ncbi:MAG TPA: hypothetical protein VFS10_15695 [Pyrinomonadaceae bacterium]|nr:hypothetical protein [Pyrinomonadaceae bacterium]
MTRHSTKTETQTVATKTARAEARMLGGIALFCYSTTLAAMLVFGYTLLALAVRGIAFPDLFARSCPCF